MFLTDFDYIWCSNGAANATLYKNFSTFEANLFSGIYMSKAAEKIMLNDFSVLYLCYKMLLIIFFSISTILEHQIE